MDAAILHFADNKKCKSRPTNATDTNYAPLSNIHSILDKLMKGMRNAWTTGKNIVIDESMIKYCSRAIKFVQYMPKKPIKHGVKVFAVCCAYSTVLLGFEVYTGAENNVTDNSALAVVL